MLLPIHRLSFSKAGLFSFLNKRPSFLQNKLMIRWIALVCVVVISFIMWLGVPRLANSLGLGLSSSSGFEGYLPLAPHLNAPLNPLPQSTKEEKVVWESRKVEVRNAFKHAWSNYKRIAFPDDELLPISGGSSNKLRIFSSFCTFLSIEFYFFTKRFNGWSVTLFDSLGTMWIMGLREEFKEAVDSIRGIQFNITKVNTIFPQIIIH